MKENTTELVFLLDRSGSMAGLESDTIGGFNAMLERQRQDPGRVRVTTVLFDDRYELLHDHLPLTQVRPLTAKDYSVRGCTALLDAMGRAILHMDRVQRETPAKRVLFVITTDGMENASREYRPETVRSLVEGHQAMGWEFLFLGANIDAIATAGRFGIGADHAVDYHADEAGTRLNYEVLSEAISHVRRCAAPLTGSWKGRIEQDYQQRKDRNG